MSDTLDLVRSHIANTVSHLNTAIPAQVISYDPTRQSCEVQPSIKIRYKDGEVRDLPPIDEVPVVFPGSNRSVISFPLTKGDTVLLVFSQRSLDNWLDSDTGSTVDPSDYRKHDLTDAVAIPGLYPFSKALTNPSLQHKEGSTDDLIIKHNVKGTNTREGEVRLKGDGSIEITAGAQFDRTKITLDNNGTMSIDTNASLSIDSSSVNITASTVSIDGDLDVTGTITGDTDVITGTVSLKTHTHIGSATAPTGPISNTGIPI